MGVKHSIVLLFLVCASLFKSIAVEDKHDYLLTTYTKKDGLPFDQINCSYLDSQGFLWVGTRNGLSVFDGYEFQNFFHNEENTHSLAANDISSITEDNKGNIWIATWGGGVSVYDKQTKKFTNYNNLTQPINIPGDNIIKLVYCDSKGRIWIVTNSQGVLFIDQKHKRSQSIPLKVKNNYSSLIELPNNYFLLANWKSLKYFHLTNDNIFELVYEFTTENPKSLHYNEKQNTIFFASNEGMYSYQLSSHIIQKTNNIQYIQSQIDLGDQWMLGDENGLSILDKKSHKRVWVFHGISVKHIHYKKAKDIIWVSTKNGLIKVEKKALHIQEFLSSHRLKASLPINNTKGDLLCITNTNAFIYKQNGNLETKINLNIPFFSSICKVTESNFLIGVNDRIISLNTLNKKNTEKELDIESKAMYYDAKSKTAYTTNGKRLYKLTLSNDGELLKLTDTIDFRKHVIIKSPYRIVHLEKGNTQDFWVSTYGSGLLRYNEKNQYIDTLLTNSFIEDIAFDSLHQILWVASRNGLKGIHITKDGQYQYHYPIINEWINFIEQDHETLWLGSINKIIKYDINSGKYDVFDNGNLTNKTFSSHSFLWGNDVCVLYKNKGIVSFKRSLENPKKDSSLAYIKYIKTPSKTHLTYDSLIQLPYDQNNITIKFSCIDFKYQDVQIFQTRILNFTNTWSNHSSKERNVNYAGMPAGKYIFQLKLKGSEKITSVPFEILPPLWKTNIAYGVYIFTSIGLLLLAYKLVKRSESKKNKIKEELIRIAEEKKYNKLRWRLFTDISHEIKTPLSLILSPLEEYLKGKQDQRLAFSTAQLVHRNAERLEQLVKQLLDFRKVESNMLKLNISEEDLIPSLKLLKESFQSLADQYEFDFQFHANHSNYVGYFDKDILERIIINLLSNAFKYTPPKGSITLSVHIDEEKELAIIIVSDTGVGMDEQTQANVFKRFETQGKVQTQGFYSSGLGLSLVKELVKLHHADINFDSKKEHGTSFQLTLPLSLAFYTSKKEQIIETKVEELTADSISTETTKNQEKQYSILLAEDNLDIHHYLKSALEKEYRVFAFMNGKEAWKNIQDAMPDLVLSDIMMPEMTGIELCEKIKAEEKTSHIPVVLLTAKGTHDKKVEGLESGADDYIKKPFRLEEIKARIKNVLKQRQRLREKYSKELIFEDKAVHVNSMDEQFIQKAITIIEKHLDNTSFSIDTFCNEMGYGRTRLYEKIKAITGMSPNELIRVIRLKKAASMIKQKSANISEITYMVGFSSQSYFSSCFKKQYGVSPTEYE